MGLKTTIARIMYAVVHPSMSTYDNSTLEHLRKSLLDSACSNNSTAISVSVCSSHDCILLFQIMRQWTKWISRENWYWRIVSIMHIVSDKEHDFFQSDSASVKRWFVWFLKSFERKTTDVWMVAVPPFSQHFELVHVFGKRIHSWISTERRGESMRRKSQQFY